MGLREWGRRIDEEAVARHRSRQPSPVPLHLVLLYAAGWLVVTVVSDVVMDRTEHVVIQAVTALTPLMYVGGGLLWLRKHQRQQRPQPPPPASGP